MQTQAPASIEPSLHEFVVEQLKARRGQWPQIASDTGVPYDTINKIAGRQIKDPGVTKIERLANYFRGSA